MTKTTLRIFLIATWLTGAVPNGIMAGVRDCHQDALTPFWGLIVGLSWPAILVGRAALVAVSPIEATKTFGCEAH